MLAIGDVQLFVTDMVQALRFWADGMQLKIAEQEISPHSGFARLDFPDGGPALRLIGQVDAWEDGRRPEHGTHPTVSFDVTASEFDGLLVRLIEHGGAQVGAVEEYRGVRVVSLADPDGNVFDLIEVPA
jgi:predicted enzyme related to lactoylglutathione lyase